MGIEMIEEERVPRFLTEEECRNYYPNKRRFWSFLVIGQAHGPMKPLTSALLRTAGMIGICAAGLLGIFFCLFLFFFGWEGVTFGSRVAAVQKHYQSLSPAEYEKIIQAALEAREIWQKEGGPFVSYRRELLSSLDAPIPVPLRYLNPRAVQISEHRIFIDFLYMMDTGASVAVELATDGNWVLMGSFEEFKPPQLLYRGKRLPPKELRPDRADDVPATNALGAPQH